MQSSTPILQVRDLRTTFRTDGGEIPAVDGVSFDVHKGQTVALVGESGCGKSTAALSLMRLLPSPPGKIDQGQALFSSGSGEESVDLLSLSEKQMQSVRGDKLAMIFQEPMTSLNPVMTVGRQIVEAIELHQKTRGRKAWLQAVDMMRRVGIPASDKRAADYPHQLSGGLRQRVMIAMALVCDPSLLIADEPTTALDVTVQAQILALLRSIQAESQLSILLITHDLGVVAEAADHVYVMYAGRIVEHASTKAIFERPLHPYTRGLLRCTPRLTDTQGKLEVIPGQVPDASAMPTGCRFHPRCSLSAERARQDSQPTVPLNEGPFEHALLRCAEGVETSEVVTAENSSSPNETQSTQPMLREIEPNHHVACWEA